MESHHRDAPAGPNNLFDYSIKQDACISGFHRGVLCREKKYKYPQAVLWWG